MSSRWYPRYVLGNPQLRVFLPDFWMILKKPLDPLPANQVQFKIPVFMTKWDVKNYLEKIYKIPVIDVRTHVMCGDIKKAKTTQKPYLIKEDDYKLATVDLPKDMIFKFPELFPKEKINETKKDMTDAEKEVEFGKLREKRKRYNNKRDNVPDWFGI
ncbi:39S ribosomal protein L23, mitochondrial-like [Oppia nitens]|uniref:39S ribosomal protein L23, mitochondrial-like n=1 Tax=Oppia nitens TaxID=1686743 RepID=UPI0023DA5B84|nr:39S ribosomal protein L23, mitochondrial-like [Oppia nitens]